MNKKQTMDRFLKASLPFLMTLALYLACRYAVLGAYAFGGGDESFVLNPLRGASLPTRIWTAFSMGFLYLRAIVFPSHLTASYHYAQVPLQPTPFGSWQTGAGMLLIFSLVYVALSDRMKSKPLRLGALTFLVPYLVVSKFLYTGGELMAERWMLAPSLGIAIICGYVFERVMSNHQAASTVVFLGILIWYTLVIIPRNTVWYSNQTLIESMVKDSPHSVQAHYLLGDMYFAKGNLAGAADEANIADNIYPDYAPLLTLRGSLEGEKGNYAEAKNLFLRAAKLDPAFITTFINLAIAYYATGEYDKSVSLYTELIPKSYGRLSQKDFVFYASALAKTKRYQESLDVIKQYIGNEGTVEVRYLLAVDYYRLGDFEKAKQFFDWDPRLSQDEKIKMINIF